MALRYPIWVVALVAGFAFCTQSRAFVTTVFTDPHPVMIEGTIGFTYAGNKFVGSVLRDGTGALYSTDLTGGNVQVFAPGVSLLPSPFSEHYVASSFGLGGFPNRDIYVANGSGVLHITNNGISSNPFVALPAPVRGILFDPVGTFGNDMLVSTTAGYIYRVNSSGAANLLASVPEDTEGMDIVPVGANFGSFDGQLIVGSEGSGSLRAIKPNGAMTTLPVFVQSAEQVSFVPLNLGASGNPVEGFYGANYTPNVVKLGVSQFTGMNGDLIVTGETTAAINRVHWNGSNFVVTVEGSFLNQPEDGIFVTADIIRGSAPEPSTLVLLGIGAMSLLAYAWRRRRS
jgi:hypothetical protein